ncbi:MULTISPECIES: DUF3883 domain-containing protein [Bradyrhizobium]|uniref:DUF3883 domain-containing protein n=1 Tax=Bradyrhizobium TaxID=374 RepID=UPI0004048105|nr:MULTISPECIES: DUF3883 domain-containing protein [Bradyrhizobium]
MDPGLLAAPALSGCADGRRGAATAPASRIVRGGRRRLVAGEERERDPGDTTRILNSDPESPPAAIRRLVGKFDPAARDARNRGLGRAGEEFVVGFERRRLARAGRDDLARDVRWVSDVDGDGYGYDVQSFETDGEQRLPKIKTTCGNERTPFWMTKRECDVAERSMTSTGFGTSATR